MKTSCLPLMCLLVTVVVVVHAGRSPAGPKTILLNRAQTKYVALSNTTAVMSDTPVQFQLVRLGLTKAANTVSIRSSEKPGWYLRHYGYRLYSESMANPRNPHIFDKDATFVERPNYFSGFTAFQSVNYPEYYISVNNEQQVFIRRGEDNSFKESASFAIGTEASLLSFDTKTFVALNNNAAIMDTTQVQFYLVRPGLTGAANTVSIMSAEKPGWYLRHYGYRLYLEPLANPRNPHIFDKDATFEERPDAFYYGFTAFQSVNYPQYYISANSMQQLYILQLSDTSSFKKNASFATEVAFAPQF